MNTTNENFIQQCLETIRFHKNKITSHASTDAFASTDANVPGLFFITETFKELNDAGREEPLFRKKTSFQIHQPKELLQVAHQRHQLFYKHILNQTVPSNHFPQRRKHFPIALSFIDLPGARQNHHAFFKMPHVHSIFIIPPKALPRFNNLVKEDFRLLPTTEKTKNVLTIDCQEMCWDWKEIKKVTNYSAKSYLSSFGINYFPEDVKSLFFTMSG